MTAAAAVGEIAALAGLVGDIYGAIGHHVTGKSVLKALLQTYHYQLKQDLLFIEWGLHVDHCQSRALNLYAELTVLAEWLASKHIRLTNSEGGPANRPSWKFPWKFSNMKKAEFKYFLGQVKHASERLSDCVEKQRISKKGIRQKIASTPAARPPPGLRGLMLRVNEVRKALGEENVELPTHIPDEVPVRNDEELSEDENIEDELSREEQLARREAQVADREAQVADREAQVADREAQLAGRGEQALVGREAQVEDREAQLN